MHKQAGLWIDHQKAVVVVVTHTGQEVKTISSGLEKHVRFSGSRGSEGSSSQDVRDRQFGNHLNAYYDLVIAVIGEADSIRIFGPGEAKGELEKRLIKTGHKQKILSVETVDKMTEPQIAARVREQSLTDERPQK